MLINKLFFSKLCSKNQSYHVMCVDLRISKNVCVLVFVLSLVDAMQCNQSVLQSSTALREKMWHYTSPAWIWMMYRIYVCKFRVILGVSMLIRLPYINTFLLSNISTLLISWWTFPRVHLTVSPVICLPSNYPNPYIDS